MTIISRLVDDDAPSVAGDVVAWGLLRLCGSDVSGKRESVYSQMLLIALAMSPSCRKCRINPLNISLPRKTVEQ